MLNYSVVISLFGFSLNLKKLPLKLLNDDISYIVKWKINSILCLSFFKNLEDIVLKTLFLFIDVRSVEEADHRSGRDL